MTPAVRKLTAVAVFAALTATLAACASPEAEPEDTSLSIRTQFVAAWNPLDWMGGGGPCRPGTQAVYEPLIQQIATDGVDELVPWLAETFELSEDRKNLSLTLREDVDFTDGSHFDAAAAATFFTALAEATDGFLETNQVTVTVTGEYSIEFDTVVPIDQGDLTGLSCLGIPSPASLEDIEAHADDPVGTGPYLLDEAVAEVSLSFVRNPDYWNSDAYPFDTVEMTVFEDDVAALNALKSGQLDATYFSDVAPAVEAESAGFDLYSARGLSPSLIIIDRDGSTIPALADVRVRRAINMVFDREAINESVYHGRGAPLGQPFFPGDPEYIEGGDERYGYDLEGARALMEEAGYADGFEITVPGCYFTAAYEPAMQQALADINITATIEPVEDCFSLFFDYWPTGNYPIAAYPMDFTPGATMDWLKNFYGGINDPHAEELYDVVVNGNAEESAAASQELGEYLLDQAWYAPMVAVPTIIAARAGVTVDFNAIEGPLAHLIEYQTD